MLIYISNGKENIKWENNKIKEIIILKRRRGYKVKWI